MQRLCKIQNIRAMQASSNLTLHLYGNQDRLNCITETLRSIALDRTSPMPITQQLLFGIRRAILSGLLPSGARLPSTRALARDLKVSRATLVEVFERLIADGIVSGRIGAGTFVAGTLTKRLDPLQPKASNEAALSSRGHRVVEAATNASKNETRALAAFRNGVPALDQFPNDVWSRHLRNAARRPGHELLDYHDAAGYLPLRRAIADRLAVTRSIDCTRSAKRFLTNLCQGQM